MIPSSCEVTRVRLQQHAGASSVDQEQALMLRARPRVQARHSILLRDRLKGTSDYLSAVPADGTFAADCGRTEIRHFRLKGSLRQGTSLFVAKEE
jgi:hypothetical protein